MFRFSKKIRRDEKKKKSRKGRKFFYKKNKEDEVQKGWKVQLKFFISFLFGPKFLKGIYFGSN